MRDWLALAFCPTPVFFFFFVFLLTEKEEETHFKPKQILVPFPNVTRYWSRGLPSGALGSCSHRSGAKRYESGNILSS